MHPLFFELIVVKLIYLFFNNYTINYEIYKEEIDVLNTNSVRPSILKYELTRGVVEWRSHSGTKPLCVAGSRNFG